MITDEGISEQPNKVEEDGDKSDEKVEKTRLTPKQIRDNIEAGEKWLKTGPYKTADARSNQWKKNNQYLMCVWPDHKEGDVEVNSFFSNNNLKRPNLYFKNPNISTTPKKPQFKVDELGQKIINPDTGRPIMVDNYKAAKVFGLGINYFLKEMEYKAELKSVLSDNLCPYGVGWIKWGYSLKTVSGHSNNQDRSVTFWCKRVDPRNLVYHWMSNSDKDCRFFAERLIMTRKDAKKYGFKIPKGYKCSLPDFLKDRSNTAKNSQDDEDLIIIWEYHDEEEKMIYWAFAPDHDFGNTIFPKEPIDNEDPFEGSCYQALVLNKNNEDIIGLSDIEPVESQALAINRLRTKQTQHVDNFGTIFSYEDGALDVYNIDNMKSNSHGLFLKVNKGHFGKVGIEGTPSMGADNENMVGAHKEDMRLVLGITDYMQGGAISRTATEGNLIQNGANIRIDEQRDIIRDFIIGGVRRLAAMIQLWGDEEMFLNIADEDFDDDFVEVLKNDYGYNPEIPFLHLDKKRIQGEFDFDFNPEDMVIRPKEVQLQQNTNLLSVIASSNLLPVLEQEDISIGKFVIDLFDLAGVDVEKFKYGGPAQIPEEKENQMFLNGMEVPEPHRKDDPYEHIMSHSRLLRQLQSQAQQVQAQFQEQSQQFMQSTLAEAQKSQDPNSVSQLNAQAQGQLQQAQQQMQDQVMKVQTIIRKVMLHLQEHEFQIKRKEAQGVGGMGGGPGPQPQGQPSASQQVGIQQQAQQVQ